MTSISPIETIVLVPDISSLCQKSKSLFVEFQEQLGEKSLKKLQSLLDWSFQHIEIEAIVISFSQDSFRKLDWEEISKLKKNQILSFFKSYQETMIQMIKSPQLLLFDIGQEISSSLFELALAADIRVAHKDYHIKNDHSFHGLSPLIGITKISSFLGNPSKRILTNNHTSEKKIHQTGLIEEVYCRQSRPQIIDQVLMENLSRSAIVRIQTKNLFFQEVAQGLQESFCRSLSSLKATLQGHEMKEGPPFRVGPRTFKKIVQNSIPQ